MFFRVTDALFAATLVPRLRGVDHPRFDSGLFREFADLVAEEGGAFVLEVRGGPLHFLLQFAEDLDDIDYGNYKGIYFNDDASKKYQDPETGAHFDHHDICMRLTRIAEKRRS